MQLTVLLILMVVSIIIIMCSQRETIFGQICAFIVYGAAGVGLANWAIALSELVK
jgi:hypothetical protein